MTILNLSHMNRSRSTRRVTFGDVLYQPGGICGPRVQLDFQLVVIYAGEARIQVQETERYVPSQHATLLLPQHRELFRFAPTCATHHSWCAITPLAVPEDLQQQLRHLPACVPLSKRMYDLIELGLAVPAGDLPSADALVESISLALLQAFVFDAGYAEGVGGLPNAVRQAQQYIDAHLGEPLNLARIAQAAHVSPQHLTRLFRRHLHTTPMRYLWQQRTQHGVELLRATGLSVAEIAARVGFQSPFHFSRLVQQRYGYAPRQLRIQIWSGSSR